MKRKPLIVHVLYRFDTGGMEHIVASLIEATQDRYRHAVIALTQCGPLRGQIEDAVVACRALGKRPGKDWLCYLRFWRALRALRPDLVQTYNLGTLDLAPLVKLAGVRLHVHAEHGRDAADPHGDVRHYQRMRRWMAPWLRRYIAVSPDLRDWLVMRVGIRAAKVAYIPNGIDAAPFSTARQCCIGRPKLGDFAPPGSVLIVNVARLDKVKDHVGLIEAFALLRKQITGVDCRLLIVGGGPQHAELAQLVAERGLAETVRLLGNCHNVAELLAECDVFALSSIAEGMPVTVLEAMASGLPVVATDVGGVAAVVQDGVTGTLVPTGDPGALAEALSTYVRDAALRHAHGDAGHARMQAHFSLHGMVRAYTELYDGLLGHAVRLAPSIPSDDRQEES